MKKQNKKSVDPKLKKFVIDNVRKAAWNIGVSHFNVDIHYMEGNKDGRDGGIIAAEMDTDRRYLRGVLRISKHLQDKWKDGEKEEVRHAIFHEISHIATQHVMDLMSACYKDEGETKDAWESLTETIARMALKIDNFNSKK